MILWKNVLSNKRYDLDGVIKARIGEDGTAGSLACNKYAVLPPCGRHGRLPANLTVSFIQH